MSKKLILTVITLFTFAITNAQEKANHHTTRSNQTSGIMAKETGDNVDGEKERLNAEIKNLSNRNKNLVKTIEKLNKDLENLSKTFKYKIYQKEIDLLKINNEKLIDYLEYGKLQVMELKKIHSMINEVKVANPQLKSPAYKLENISLKLKRAGGKIAGILKALEERAISNTKIITALKKEVLLKKTQ